MGVVVTWPVVAAVALHSASAAAKPLAYMKLRVSCGNLIVNETFSNVLNYEDTTVDRSGIALVAR